MKKLEIKRKHCSSCEENFYNDQNPYGIKECWHLKDVKLIQGKVIGVWQNPPYDHVKTEWKPKCWRKKGVVFIPNKKEEK